jgi:hypothetical protein
MKENTLLHYTSLFGNVQILENAWKWSKRRLKPEELYNKIILDLDNDRQSAWHLAAEKDKLEVLDKL